MIEVLLCAVISAFALAFGLWFGFRLGGKRAREDFERELGTAKQQAERILDDASAKAQNRLKDAEIEVKQKLLEQQSSFDEELKSLRAEQGEIEKRLRKKEEQLDRRAEALEARDAEFKNIEAATKKAVKQAKKRIKHAEDVFEEATAKLEELAGLTQEQARQRLLAEILDDAKLGAAREIKRIEEEAKEEAEKRAKEVITTAIQRYAGEYVAERSVNTIVLPSDDVKGRIIGREGRNIRAIEAATGVDLIVDDTPEAVVISGFDPVRREIASLSLQRLIADGRIHPSRIEEVVAKVSREVEQSMKEAGDQAAFELGLNGLHGDVLAMIGRLKYRTSYGQNIWNHSMEVAWLCGLMAAELGLNVKRARRAGLLHDIGKAMDHELEGSHALIGAEFLKKHGEDPVVINAVGSHHSEMPPESLYAHLVMAADALSGARPGARREVLESYIKRLHDLEQISASFDGVEKCFAIQAGREVRVLVDSSSIDDEHAIVLSRDIARKIEQELTYPGRIKVCVIRETRAMEFAR
ncbi:MAG: ribonuclease Y [Myxococcota bacterium]|jgi:ribonuclease Y|nr:ribonuclease Y [Myxococcota bacterium]